MITNEDNPKGATVMQIVKHLKEVLASFHSGGYVDTAHGPELWKFSAFLGQVTPYDAQLTITRFFFQYQWAPFNTNCWYRGSWEGRCFLDGKLIHVQIEHVPF